MFNSLRWRMALLLAAFVLLIFISVAATAQIVETQTRDALVINLAGRQRMLIQQMAVNALEIERDDGGERTQSLREAISTFEQTLDALSGGGMAPYLPDQTVAVPAADSAGISAALEREREGWETLRPHFEVIATQPPGSPQFAAASRAVEQFAPELVQRADDVVRMYEADAVQKTAQLRWIQGIFLVSALALAAFGSIVIRRAVLSPLHTLSLASARIRDGDLGTPIRLEGPDEILALARRMDEMRAQLKGSRGELEAQVARRTRELAALYEVSQEISSHLEIDRVLDSVTSKARELMGSEVAFICLLDETGQFLEMRAYSGSADAVHELSVPVEDPSADHVLSAQAAVSCNGGGCRGTCRIISARFRASHQAIPLRGADGIIGALCVGRSRPEGFTTDEARLLTKLGQSAAIALENARLYQQGERIAALEERQRIAADMHDGLAQTLSYLEMKAERLTETASVSPGRDLLPDLAHLRQTLGEANQDVRRSIAHLQQRSLPRKTLAERLADLVAEIADQDRICVEFAAPADNPVALPPDQAEQVLRVAGEALQNARRHAKASRICVRLEHEDNQMALVVQDDGRGFDPCVLREGAGHFGVSIMRARAARLGGMLSLESAPGRGTRVRLVCPAPKGHAGRKGG